MEEKELIWVSKKTAEEFKKLGYDGQSIFVR